MEEVNRDELRRRLARTERQRRIGAELAAREPSTIERAIINIGLATVEQQAGQ